MSLRREAQALESHIKSLPGEPDKESSKWPHFVVSFDEAHALTDSSELEPWTTFTELRRGLHKIYPVWGFFFFLSTTGKMYQFTPPTHVDPSLRMQENMFRSMPPITETGFDMLAMKALDVKTGDKEWDNLTHLEKVTSLRWMAHMGRPLYVVNTLLQIID